MMKRTISTSAALASVLLATAAHDTHTTGAAPTLCIAGAGARLLRGAVEDVLKRNITPGFAELEAKGVVNDFNTAEAEGAITAQEVSDALATVPAGDKVGPTLLKLFVKTVARYHREHKKQTPAEFDEITINTDRKHGNRFWETRKEAVKQAVNTAYPANGLSDEVLLQFAAGLLLQLDGDVQTVSDFVAAQARARGALDRGNVYEEAIKQRSAIVTKPFRGSV